MKIISVIIPAKNRPEFFKASLRVFEQFSKEFEVIVIDDRSFVKISKLNKKYCELLDNCDCRKSKTGMLLKAKEDFDIDLNKSWIIRDSKADIEAGKIIKCKTILISKFDKKKNILNEREIKPDFIEKNLKNAVDIVY